MASFAPGTSQQYMNDYYRRVGPSLGGTGPEMPRPPMARPDSRNSVTVGGGKVSPYSPPGSPPRAGQQSNRPFQGTLPPVVPQQQSPDMSAYKPSRSQPQRWTGSEWVTLRSKRDGQAQPVQPQSQGTPYGSAPQPVFGQPLLPAYPSRPAGRYAHGTSPEYMAANPDWLPTLETVPRPPSGAPRGTLRHGPNDNLVGAQPGPYRPGTFQPVAWGPDGMSSTADDRPSPDYGPGWPAGLRPDAVRPSITVSQPPSVAPGGGLGNLAYSPPDQRPQPFTTSVRGPDGNQYDPGQFFPMRDAFIQNINDARSAFAANPSAGRPQMDMGRMWGRAGDMVQQGWQNPLRGLLG